MTAHLATISHTPASHHTLPESTIRPTAPPRNHSNLSRAEIREMANPEVYGPRVEGARQIQQLQRAERDLLYISIFVILLGGGGALTCLTLSVVFFKGRFFSQSPQSCVFFS